MYYENTPNLLLEAISYLGRKASNNTWSVIDLKIKQKNLKNTSNFHQTFNKLKNLANYLDKNCSIPDTTLKKYFSNLDGFPFNTIGSSSICFLIFYGVLENFNGNFELLLEEMHNFSTERIAYNIAEALDISDNFQSDMIINTQDFMNSILSLSIPAESKIAILETYNNYHKYLDDISLYLKDVINILENEIHTLSDITDKFNEQINQIGCVEYLHNTSQFKPTDKLHYCMRPFIFGMDTNITSKFSINHVTIYSGILRKELLDMLNTQTSDIDNIYQAFNLLGDRTRFDILCYLRKHSAYGQELSNHFNLSRNTIHHHMSKLINYGFVVCTTDGNRVYYSINEPVFEIMLSKQKELFCPESEYLV